MPARGSRPHARAGRAGSGRATLRRRCRGRAGARSRIGRGPAAQEVPTAGAAPTRPVGHGASAQQGAQVGLLERAAQDGGEPQHRALGRRQPVDLAGDQRLDGGRQRVDGRAGAGGEDEPAQEQRVAAGAHGDRGHGVRRQRHLAEDLRGERCGPGGVERAGDVPGPTSYPSDAVEPASASRRGRRRATAARRRRGTAARAGPRRRRPSGARCRTRARRARRATAAAARSRPAPGGPCGTRRRGRRPRSSPAGRRRRPARRGAATAARRVEPFGRGASSSLRRPGPATASASGAAASNSSARRGGIGPGAGAGEVEVTDERHRECWSAPRRWPGCRHQKWPARRRWTASVLCSVDQAVAGVMTAASLVPRIVTVIVLGVPSADTTANVSV